MNKIEKCRSMLVATLKTLTDLSDEAISELVPSIPIQTYKKGTILLSQGGKPDINYYLLMGCIRQYFCNEHGKEITVDIYTNEQSINMFSYADEDGNSMYSLSCLEECIMVSCPEIVTRDFENTQPEFSNMLKAFFQKQFIDLQKNLASFKAQSPEERFRTMVKNRPELLKRVPQNILASYLDITPETFSRFKKKL